MIIYETYDLIFRMDKNTCSKCGMPLEDTRAGKQRYCRSCHAAYMRMTRPKHSELTDKQRKKANCRSYLNVYLNQGRIQKLPCAVCGSINSQAHHENYSKPLKVVWLCRNHHLRLHAAKKKVKVFHVSHV